MDKQKKEKIGNLRLIMAREGVSGNTICKILKINRSHFSLMKAGRLTLLPEEELKIASFLNCKRSEIFPFTEF